MIIFGVEVDDIDDIDMEVYGQVAGYSDMADKLAEGIGEEQSISIQEKQRILYPMIDEMRGIANRMVDVYIMHLKDRNNKKNLDDLQLIIDTMNEKLGIFKNKVYELYK